MNLKQQLIDFGCGAEFVDIALNYAQFYQPQQNIETFIEYVEVEHAKVEAVEDIQNLEKEIVNPTELNEALAVFENEEIKIH